jgi:diguanylate cyclase (GGDEF)-like protein
MEQVGQKNEELKKANAILKERSIHDALTEVYNPRFFHEFLKLETARSIRFKRTFSLLLIDVDHLADYHDSSGTTESDKILVTLATILKQGFRKVDIIARYGGEKFVVLLPETEKEKAFRAAEKIKAYVGNYPFPNRASQPQGMPTVSIGVASCPQDGTTGAALLHCAGDALVQTRKNGKNTVK